MIAKSKRVIRKREVAFSIRRPRASVGKRRDHQESDGDGQANMVDRKSWKRANQHLGYRKIKQLPENSIYSNRKYKQEFFLYRRFYIILLRPFNAIIPYQNLNRSGRQCVVKNVAYCVYCVSFGHNNLYIRIMRYRTLTAIMGRFRSIVSGFLITFALNGILRPAISGCIRNYGTMPLPLRLHSYEARGVQRVCTEHIL